MKKVFFAWFLLSVSCKSTESINRFAKSATTASSEIGRSKLSFGHLCRLYNPSALALYRDTSLYARGHAASADCRIYDQSDSLVNLISQTLVNYFSLLQAVSDKKLLAYHANDLIASLSGIQSQLIPGLALNAEKVSAIKGLLNTVLNEPLQWYRNKKLVRTMQANDVALDRVLDTYLFILDTALTGELNQARENYTSFVYAPLYEFSRTPVEKVMVNRDYAQFMSSLHDENQAIRKFVNLLQTIQKDHHLLAFGKSTERFAEIEAEIAKDILIIHQTIAEIIQLIK